MVDRFYDAHNHLADPRLVPHWKEIETSLESAGIATCVVNGTSPEDWEAVYQLSSDHKWIIPSIGLHPWKVPSAPEDWQQTFISWLNRGVCAIGEIGLDKWIEGYDLGKQQAAFQWQLEQAARLNLPVSIHCLKATGPLMEVLRAVQLPARGFHLHAYSGPVQLIPELVDLGAFFSFNSGQLGAKAKTAPAALRAVPADRLLLETDAPHGTPSPELRSHSFRNAPSERPLNHPGNLKRTYEIAAKLRDCPLETLTRQVEINFRKYFLEGLPTR